MFRSIFAAALLVALSAQGAFADAWRKLLSPAQLTQMQDEADDLLILDIRPHDGEFSYSGGHIPDAISAPYERWRGPKQNPGATPSDAELTELFQSIGATPDRPTVVVHQGANASEFGAAARVYWTLKSAGVERIAILNGGMNAWIAAELPLWPDEDEAEPSDMVVTLSDKWLATRDDVAAVIAGDKQAALLDARPMRQYLGITKHGAAKSFGTLPGATHFSQSEWFDLGSALMSPADQASIVAGATGVSPKEEIISFCNTGHWSATNWFALSELAGYDDVKLYPGSMVEWTRQGGALENAPTQ